MTRMNRVLSLVVCACVFAYAGPVLHAAIISSSGLLAEYGYETSSGVAVADGQSAAGAQIDDTGLNPAGANHAIGSPFVAAASSALQYSSDVPAAIAAGSSLSFGMPETNSNYVSVPIFEDSTLYNIGSGDFRVEAWFKTTDTNRANIFSSYSGGAPNTAFNLEVHTGNRVRMYLQDSTGVSEHIIAAVPGITYSDNQWHQLIAVREEDQMTLTLDGVLAGELTSTHYFSESHSEFRIGQDNRGSSTPKFTGQLDNVRLYNSFDTSSPVALFDFDTAAGIATTDGQSAVGMVDDTSGNDFTGTGFSAEGNTPAGEPQYRADVPAVLAGTSTRSIEFQQGNAGLEDASFPVTTEVAAVTLSDFTVETWFKTTDAGRSGLITGWQDGNNETFGLELHTDNRVRLYIEGGGITGSSGDLNVVPPDVDTRDGEWHHAAARREGTEMTVWVDGIQIGTGTDPVGSFEIAVSHIRLGNDNRGGALLFDGSLDNSRLWTRALSGTEIEALAAGSVPMSESPTFTSIASGTWDTDPTDPWDQTGTIPAAGNAVVVNGGLTITADGAADLGKSLSITDTDSTVNVDGTLTISELVDVGPAATLTVNGTLTAATATVAGTLAGSGTINADPIDVTGIIAPGGDGIGTLTLGSGKMQMDPASTVEAQVSVAGEIVADQITVSAGGLLMLGGTLAVSTLGDRANADSWAEATPSVVLRGLDGDIGEVGVGGYEFTSVTPEPNPDTPPHLGRGVFLRAVTYEVTSAPIVDSVDLDLLVALGGDTDGDGKVWLSDWAALRANFGNTATGKTWTEGNFDPWVDDKVWLSDWAALRASFGNSDYTAAGAAAVPEPGTIAMLLAALALLALAAWRRR